MKKIIFIMVSVLISHAIFAQSGAIITNNNTDCTVSDVKVYATATHIGDFCGGLITNAIFPALATGGGVAAWNSPCTTPAFPGWGTMWFDPLISPCPNNSVDPTFIWTDDTFTFNCPSPCPPISGVISNSSGGCLSGGTIWHSSCGSYSVNATYGTNGNGIDITFH